MLIREYFTSNKKKFTISRLSTINIDDVTVDHYVDIHKILHCPLTVHLHDAKETESKV